MSGLEVLACSLDTDYYAPIAQFPESLSTVMATFRGGDVATFWVYSSGWSRLAVDKVFPLIDSYFVDYHTNKLNKY